MQDSMLARGLRPVRRIVQASSPADGLVADFFAGSGTTGAACYELGRRFLLVDNNPEALAVMAKRFAAYPDVEYVGYTPERPAGQQSLFAASR